MADLHFAQLSDIHISALGDHHDLLSGRSADFLADILAKLNQWEELDFVLITGDLFDLANEIEFQQFQEVIQTLNKPYYIIPGNHDRRPPGSSEGLTRHQFARHFNPQVAARPDAPNLQAGYWSIEVHPQIQLIGLDSIKDENWGGLVDAVQMDWLKDELARHEDKLVIVAVHHPLHPLAPIDDHPDWLNFVCDNGPHLLKLLDDTPHVKIVLTGHHHMSKVDRLGQRLHLAAPAIAIYPCAYRTFSLTRQVDQRWLFEWRTHPATDDATVTEARKVMAGAWQKVGFEPDFVEQHVLLAVGSKDDRNGSAIFTFPEAQA
jgi:3',5'-cyclic AMP phosphodiesterase CpdA